jgi:hypothetical protein
MIIVWRGAGILGLFIPLICTGLVYLTVYSFTSDNYVSEHRWPVGAGLLFSAAVLYFFARIRDRDEPGEDSLYFIPLRFWPFIIAPVAIGYMFAGPPPVQAAAQSASDRQAYVAPRRPTATKSLKPAANSTASGITIVETGITYDGKKWPPDPQPQPRYDSGAARQTYEAPTERHTNIYTQYVANLTLEGVAFDPNGHSTAVLSGQRVRAGDHLASYTVLSIQKDSLTLRTPTGRKRTLRIGETEDPL